MKVRLEYPYETEIRDGPQERERQNMPVHSIEVTRQITKRRGAEKAFQDGTSLMLINAVPHSDDNLVANKNVRDSATCCEELEITRSAFGLVACDSSRNYDLYALDALGLLRMVLPVPSLNNHRNVTNEAA